MDYLYKNGAAIFYFLAKILQYVWDCSF